MTVLELGDVFLYGGFPAILVFTLFYGLRSRWWRYAEGRALLAKSASLVGITLTVILATWLGSDYTGRPIVRLVSYAFFFVASWWFAVRLIISQHRSRQEERRLVAELHEAQRREGTV